MPRTAHFKIICFFVYLLCKMIYSKRYDDIKTNILNSIRLDEMEEM